jgi:hypothetical protein
MKTDFIIGAVVGALGLYVYSDEVRKNVKDTNTNLRELEERISNLESLNQKIAEKTNIDE